MPFDVFGIKRGRKIPQLLRHLGPPSLGLIVMLPFATRFRVVRECGLS